VRTTTAAVLEDWGHRVFQAADGAEGIRVLEANDCDCNLLITDYAMPHVSGSECIRKARDHCPGLPALIITGYAEAEAIGDRPDGVEILLKPFTPAALEGAIARTVGAVVPAG
jgi:CheY-like chemotaxis protein